MAGQVRKRARGTVLDVAPVSAWSEGRQGVTSFHKLVCLSKRQRTQDDTTCKQKGEHHADLS